MAAVAAIGKLGRGLRASRGFKGFVGCRVSVSVSGLGLRFRGWGFRSLWFRVQRVCRDARIQGSGFRVYTAPSVFVNV